MKKTRKPFRPAGPLTGGIVVLALLALCAAFLPQPALAQASCVRNHTVAAGDTVSNLAETYKVTTAELIAANSLTEPYTIFVGQVLCIPGTTTAATSTSTSTAASTTSNDPLLQLSIVGNKLVIETANFPKVKASYYVKAGEMRSTYSEWIKLGRMLVRKDGAGDGIFLLPKALRKTRVIDVCVKNVETDAVYCGRIVQPK